MKVKKTDLPVLPPEQDILPSLDDESDESQSDIDDDQDDVDMDDDEMMAADEGAGDSDDDDYDDEDIDESEQDDEDTWNSLSTAAHAKYAKETTTASGNAPKATAQPAESSKFNGKHRGECDYFNKHIAHLKKKNGIENYSCRRTKKHTIRR